MQKYNGTLLRKFDDPVQGNASVGTSVVVRKKSDNSLAPIYSVDDINSIQKPNPFTTDAFGRYSFFAPNGKYIIQFGDGSDEIEISMVDNLDHNSLSGRNAAGAHSASAISNANGGSVQDFIDETNTITSELKNIVTVVSSSEISSINKTSISAIKESKNSAHWVISPTTNGLENTPDKIKMADNRYANRVGVHNMTRSGLVTSKDFGHRCGQIMYIKVSQSHSKLLTNFDKYKAETNQEFVPTVRYLDSQSGVIGAGGESWATAEKRWAEVIAMNPDIVYVKNGLLNGGSRITSFDLTKDMAIIAVGGPVFTGSIQGGLWSKEPGYTNVYKRTVNVSGASTFRVFDIADRDVYGSPMVLEKLNSIASVDSTPGSWYIDSTTKDVYVHTSSSRALSSNDTSILTTLIGANTVITYKGNFKLYLKGIHFWSGLDKASGKNALTIKSDGIQYHSSVFYAEDCAYCGALGSSYGNGLGARDVGIVINKHCEASVNSRDGFNYHHGQYADSLSSSLSPHFIEIDCFAGGNGVDRTDGNNQGSTAHENCKGYRINGIYTNHKSGGNITDIESSKVWMTGIVSQGSSLHGMRLSTTGSTYAEDAEWWIDGAVVTDNSTISADYGYYGYGDLTFDGPKTKVHIADVIQDKSIYAGVEIVLVDEDFH